MAERIKNRFEHLADLEREALKHRATLHTLAKGQERTLHSIYTFAAPVTPENTSSQTTTRNATTSEIAAVLKRGIAATIPEQERHRNEGGRGRPR